MREQSVEKLNQRGDQALARGKTREAIALFGKAILAKPDCADAHYGLAMAYYLRGDTAQAAVHFQEVTRLDPLRGAGFVNLGATLLKLDALEQAVAALQRGLQLDSKVAEGHYNLGVALKRGKKVDLAVNAYKKALQLDPQMADAALNLGNIYLNKNQFSSAVRCFERACKVRPTWEKAQKNLRIARSRANADAFASSPSQSPQKTRLVSGNAPKTQMAHSPADTEMSLYR